MSINPIASGGAPSTSGSGASGDKQPIVEYWKGRIEEALKEGVPRGTVPWISVDRNFTSPPRLVVALERKDYDLSEGGPGGEQFLGTIQKVMWVADCLGNSRVAVNFTCDEDPSGGGKEGPVDGLYTLKGLVELGGAVVESSPGVGPDKEAVMTDLGKANDYIDRMLERARADS